ncbi:MAG: putative monovalent cation/H+ antiporter subunit B [Candidatus Scalindua rubra]|uniref:Putative monovalent cation/H+ antiporter subunit B n=1 Tax=Candidatus Scalindua rubra TaxID=1872076 RepID=A0A1E3XAP7_9BACT|nr:MAG: putative monovalent cation/H+ antiporter subunit B [Candidatus Scalindua rubra]
MIDILLLLILLVCAIFAVFMRDLLSAVIILGVYSFIMATVFTKLNAVDVAFTEASVGAGITSVLMIAALSRAKRYEYHYTKEQRKRPSALFLKIMSLFFVIITGAVLVYGTIDMPTFGDPEAPASKHVSPRYIEESYHETGVKNFVTAVLASYRGYDTLGETTVIFTAGISVILLLRRWKKD